MIGEPAATRASEGLAVVWPPFGLRLRASFPARPDGTQLELHGIDDATAAELAELAEDVVEPEREHYLTWLPGRPDNRAARQQAFLRYHWGRRAEMCPDDWSLTLAVRRDGVLVGCQDLFARGYPVTREGTTGSWLGRAHQGRGTGTVMRAMLVELAFRHLGARAVTSSAVLDNRRSLGVSRRLGYVDDGLEVIALGGTRRVLQRLRLTPEAFEATRPPAIAQALEGMTVEGLDPVLVMLQIPGGGAAPAGHAEGVRA